MSRVDLDYLSCKHRWVPYKYDGIKIADGFKYINENLISQWILVELICAECDKIKKVKQTNDRQS